LKERENGEGIGTYPKLAGKSATLLIERLNKLKKGIGQTSKRDLMIPLSIWEALDHN